MTSSTDMPEPQPQEQELGPNASLLRLIADSVPALIAYYEAHTLMCRFANRAYAEYNGWTPQAILGKTVREAVGEAAWQRIEPYVKLVVAGETVKYVREQALPSGEPRVIEVHLLPHFDDTRVQIGNFVLIHDITAQWQAERAVRDSEERMRKLAEATTEGIVFHRHGVVTDTNEALQHMLGWAPADIIGRQILDFVAPAWKSTVNEYMQSGRESPYEAAILDRQGLEIPVEIVGKTMPVQGDAYRLAVVRDIRERKAAQERIEFMALHDPLTELPNRLNLMERLDCALAMARRRKVRVATLFIDLDNFKQVNDSLGHHAGDVLLREVARRLKQGVREADVVSRLGGDEFLIVLSDLSSHDDAGMVAANLIQAVSAAVIIDARTVSVSPSIGISVFPDDAETAVDLIRNADAAMYGAKSRGRATYQFFAMQRTASD